MSRGSWLSRARVRAWWLRTFLTARRLASDKESFRAFRRAARPGAEKSGATEEVRVRPLGGHTLHLRPGTTDAGVAWTALTGGFHLPPPDLREPRLIWDLGANIGVTMAHFAHLYPGARVVGVELEGENAALARRNTAPWSDRCELIEGAVWPEEGEVHFDALRPANTLRVGSGSAVAEVQSLQSLLERAGAPDYVKMDIEGAESTVLTEATDWAPEVGCIAVECHGPYSVERCAQDLGALGFDTRKIRRPGNLACVIGMR